MARFFPWLPLSVGGLFVSSLTAMPAIAQTSDDATGGDGVDLEFTALDRLLNQSIYTPLRKEATLNQVTRAAYVVTQEQIKAQGWRTVGEALKYLPGVLSDGTQGGYLGAPGSQWMRGGRSTQTLILLNGRSLSDVGYFGGFDLSTITTDQVQQIELVPGGGSTLYGSDAIGGVINIITTAPEPGKGGSPPQTQVQGQIALGNLAFHQEQLTLTHRLPNLGLSLSWNRLAADNDYPYTIDRLGGRSGIRRNADVRESSVQLGIKSNLNDRQTLALDARFLDKNLGIANSVTAAPGTDRTLNRNWLFDLTWTANLGQKDNPSASQLSARLFHDDLNQKGIVDIYEAKRQATGLELQHNWQIAPNQNLVSGLSYRHAYGLNTSTFGGVTTTNYSNSLDQTALFASYTIDATPQLRANLGLRQDFNSLADGGATSPSVGLRWQVGKDTAIRANYSRSFRVPLISDRFGFAGFGQDPNPKVKPERGTSFDLGVDQKIGDRALIRLSYFHNSISDALAYVYNPATFTGQVQNIQKVESNGVEADFHWQLTPRLFFFGNYTLNDPRIRQDTTAKTLGKEVAFTGADSPKLGVGYETPKGFYTGVMVRSLGSFFTNNTNTFSLPGYTVWDWNLRYPLQKNLVLQASWENIFDRRYEVYADSFGGSYPGAGSRVQVGLQFRF